MINGSDLEMKDAVGPSAMATGFTLTMTPALALQIVGAIVGLLGIYYTRARIVESRLARLETKRANDLAEEKFNWEKDRAEAENTKTKATSDELQTNQEAKED